MPVISFMVITLHFYSQQLYYPSNLSQYQRPRMANIKKPNLLLLLFLALIWTAPLIQGTRIQKVNPYPKRVSHNSATEEEEEDLKGSSKERRLMIGSVAPACTYNECRGCKFKCRAEQVPVEGNDPMNSAYHYKCICRR